MRKLVYLLVITVIFAACTSEEGYVVTGTIEGGAEGDIVYLSFVEKGNFANIDSSVIKNGVFTFKGRRILQSIVTSGVRRRLEILIENYTVISFWKTGKLT